jgi:TonB family protein
MRDLAFVESSVATLPRHRPSTLAIAAGFHIVLFALLILVKTQPVRVSSPGSPYAGIAAYVAAATGASTPKPAEPKKTAPTTKAAKEAPKEAPKEDQSNAGSAGESTGVVGGQAAAGPVRIGSGGTLTLLKKVSPIYPSVMQSARIPGLVLLDAVIHSDGTIGDITVLRSTNDAFARAAIDAVKKWRYTPLPYEGIVTVTVTFTLT